MQTRNWLIRAVTRMIFTLACAGSASMAAAEDAGNAIELIGSATRNPLVLEQSDGGSHRATIRLGGELVLRSGDSWANQPPSLLRPNSIVQSGREHTLTVDLAGAEHQVAAWQSGQDHSASIRSQGRGNAVSISQAGRRNNAAATQSGSRNVVAIRQE